MLRWIPTTLSPDQSERLKKALQKWEGTPYHEGAQVPSGGVDCFRFVSAVADDMRGRPWVSLPRYIADASMHSKATALRLLRQVMRLHECRVSSREGLIAPGDVIVSGPKGGGPGHAQIVGPDGYIWHCVQRRGVHRGGIDLAGQEFFAVLRVKEDLWAL